MTLTKIVTGALILIMAVSTQAFGAGAKTKRKPAGLKAPPQFVILAFDGSFDLGFWEESQRFADTVPTHDVAGNKTTLKFTYFVNPVYYISEDIESKSKIYKTPRLGKAVSCIGWSDNKQDVIPRVNSTAKAYRNGHEIASHANSHCSADGVDPNDPLYGKPWGLADWKSEFEQFNYMLFNAFKLNGINKPESLGFNSSTIIGFRAPKLATTASMWPALKASGFRYDTSLTSAPTYWPRRHPATRIWNFPLGVIKVAGTNKTTFSMDYNWMHRQTGGKSNPNLSTEARDRLRNQVVASYKYYFKINYFGGRGPIHIGHHFSKWNSGAYWLAMQDFAKFVCNKPDVKCVTYREYEEWLTAAPGPLLASYRNGDFDRLRDDGTIKNISTPVLASVRLEQDSDTVEAVTDVNAESQIAAAGWRKQLSINFEPLPGNASQISREDLVAKVGVGNEVVLRASLVSRDGEEINAETRKISKIGTDDEETSEPLEEKALQGEGADAHTIPE